MNLLCDFTFKYPKYKSLIIPQIFFIYIVLICFSILYLLGESTPLDLPATKFRSKPQVGKGKGDKGKGKSQKENAPPIAPLCFTEDQEEEIACWVRSKKLLYDMKDRQYKDKALRRGLWEEKGAEYGVDCKYKIFTFQLL